MARIYCVTNKINGKQYVGQTVTEHSRQGHGHAVRDAYRKYGVANFTYEPVLTGVLSSELLDYAEKFWIEVMGSMVPNGYNLEAGGKRGKIVYHAPQLGKPHDAKTRQKMSESQIQRWASYTIHPNIGKKHTDETRAKMSASHTGRKQSAEERAMRSEAIKAWHKKRKEQSCH